MSSRLCLPYMHSNTLYHLLYVHIIHIIGLSIPLFSILRS
jgi:hypothetical protein